jgi:cytidylate kinase
VRAERRVVELQHKGENVSFTDTLNQVQRRDQLDSMRAVAPLRRAKDAAIIDSSSLSIDETVLLMAQCVRAFDFSSDEA